MTDAFCNTTRVNLVESMYFSFWSALCRKRLYQKRLHFIDCKSGLFKSPFVFHHLKRVSSGMTVLSFIILSISLAKGHPGNPKKIDIFKRHPKRQTSPAEVLHMSIFTDINALKPCRGQITISLHQCRFEGSSLANSRSACQQRRVIQRDNMWQHDTTLLQFHQGSNVLANFTINLHQRHLIIDSTVVAMKRPWCNHQAALVTRFEKIQRKNDLLTGKGNLLLFFLRSFPIRSTSIIKVTKHTHTLVGYCILK